MPVEFSMLDGKPPPFAEFPCCGAKPFDQMMRGLVQASRWWGLRKRYCAVICYGCKEIVGYEDPTGKETARAIGILTKAARLLPG